MVAVPILGQPTDRVGPPDFVEERLCHRAATLPDSPAAHKSHPNAGITKPASRQTLRIGVG